ncbi:hypothetical protein UB51_25475 [Paenibacillus sp. IHBB 10380]|nr:hypothetical protein UB51_25475 [Paenibacillus sp. IHBB 10380]
MGILAISIGQNNDTDKTIELTRNLFFCYYSSVTYMIMNIIISKGSYLENKSFSLFFENARE